MSDVVVSVTESTTNVTVTEQDVAVAVTETNVDVSASSAGIQGASYTPGDPIYVTVRNATGATLPLGTIVYTSGGNGTHTQVSPALATSDATSARVLGWLAESIANNASGLCQVEGYLDGVDTQGIANGTQLYLSGTVAGAFQTTKPQAPVHLVYVGVAVKASAGNGRVYVKVQNGYELDELHDVQIVSKANNDVLQYDSATSLWKNESLLNAGIASLGSANAFTTGGHTITNDAIGTVPLAIKGFSGQTGDLLQIQNNGATNLAVVSSSGTFRTAGLITAGNVSNVLGQLTVYSTATSRIGAVIQGSSGQTADLQQWQNSGSTAIAKVDKNGAVSANYFGPSGAGLLGYLDWTGSSPLLQTGGTAVVGLRVRGAASQTANLQEWQASDGSTKSYIDSNGRVMSQTAGNFGGLSAGQAFLGVQTQAGVVGLLVKGAASQSANLQEWQNSAGTVLAKVDSAGGASFSSGNATITSGGIIRGLQVSTNVDYSSLREENSGGLLRLTKQTAAAANPASGQAKIYLRDGTNAGTLKLVVRAGAAGAETTILDNIPQ